MMEEQSLNLNTTPQNGYMDQILDKIGDFFHYLAHLNFGLVGHVTEIVLSVLSIFFLFVISYCIVRMYELRQKEHEHLHHEIAEYAHHQAEKEEKKRKGEGKSKNEQWNKVLEYLFSTNPGDWKLAVIEADLMLDRVTTEIGLKGENLGERLKVADREHFHTLGSAWEAHIVRNKIAHEGTAFELSLHEAKRVIALYELVFREFGFI